MPLVDGSRADVVAMEDPVGRGREQELKQAHNARVMERARDIVAQAREQDRLRRCANLAALKALAAVHDAYTNLVCSTTSDVDQQRWRGRQEVVATV